MMRSPALWAAFTALACNTTPDPVAELPEPEPVEYAPPSIQEVYPGENRVNIANALELKPAFELDESYASLEPVDVRRVVYSATFSIGNADAPPTLAAPSGELHLEVGRERLRARFVGTVWPLQPGSQVRLREDHAGSYVFDAEGGRPFAPGQLAGWFEGGPATANPSLRIGGRREASEETAFAQMVCALFAEWSRAPLSSISRRCNETGMPESVRLGPWRLERTASIRVQIPRSSLRADHVGPPADLGAVGNSRAFFPPGVMAQLPPRRRRSSEGADGLEVRNGTLFRQIIVASGVPIAWVGPGVTTTLAGLPPGDYEISGIRPLGQTGAHKRIVQVPGRVDLGTHH